MISNGPTKKMPKKKITDHDALRIRSMLESGYTASKIAEIYNLHPVYVRRRFQSSMHAAHVKDRERGLKNCQYPNLRKWLSEHTEMDLDTIAQYAGVKERVMFKWYLSRPSLPDDLVARLMRITKLTREEIIYKDNPNPVTIDGYTIPPKDK